MSCYACERDDTQRCSRCGNNFCPDHGGDLCSACLDPLNAAPSRGVFRIALGGLLVGSVLALWLLIRPPSVPGDSSSLIQSDSSATPALTPQGSGQPATPTPTAAPTDAPTPAPTEGPTPAPTDPPAPAPLEYVVQEGDTWNGIAEAYGLDGATLAAANGLTLEDVLQPGQVIIIPQ